MMNVLWGQEVLQGTGLWPHLPRGEVALHRAEQVKGGLGAQSTLPGGHCESGELVGREAVKGFQQLKRIAGDKSPCSVHEKNWWGQQQEAIATGDRGGWDEGVRQKLKDLS